MPDGPTRLHPQHVAQRIVTFSAIATRAPIERAVRPQCGARLVLLAATSLACACGEGDASGAIVRDSAGIRIVESPESAMTRVAFVVDSQPALRIGQAVGDSAYELASVVDATRLADGGVVIALGGPMQELRYYDANGTYLRTAGRRGGGPGEFSSIRAVVRLPGDSVLVADGGGRLSRLGPTGDFASSGEYRTLAGPVSFVGQLANGEVIGYRQRMGVLGEQFEYSHWFTRHAPGAGEPDTIVGPLPSRGAMVDGIITRPLFAAGPIGTLDGDVLHIASGSAHEIRTYAVRGGLTRIARVKTPDRRVTAEDVAREREAALVRTRPERREALARSQEKLPTAEFFPAFISTMLVDPDGRLWVRRFATRGESVAQWLVFSPDGALLGSASAPGNLTVFEIGRDWMLGSRPGEDDAPTVVLHRYSANVTR